jgi:hypothetical protein
MKCKAFHSHKKEDWMGVELHLWRVAPEHLDQMLKEGCASYLDDPRWDDPRWETEERNWLLLDEMVLAFMNNELPTHPVLFNAVMGGVIFQDSEGRYDLPRYLTAAEVERIAANLGAVSANEIRERFMIVKEKWGLTDESIYAHLDPAIKEKMGLKDISPFDHINQRFGDIVNYYQVAAENRQAMLLLLY